MKVNDRKSLILDIAFSNARELEQLARKYRHKKLTREQFTAAVEEISTKLRQQIIALMELEGLIEAETPDREVDIPF